MGMSMYGKMSTGMVTMADAPKNGDQDSHDDERIGAAKS